MRKKIRERKGQNKESLKCFLDSAIKRAGFSYLGFRGHFYNAMSIHRLEDVILLICGYRGKKISLFSLATLYGLGSAYTASVNWRNTPSRPSYS